MIVVQGDQDALVRVEVTRQWVAEMKRLGMQHTYIEIAGGDYMRVIARDRNNMRKVFETFSGAVRK